MFLTNTIHVRSECQVFYNWAAMIFFENGFTCEVHSDHRRLSSSWSDNSKQKEIWGSGESVDD